MASAELAASVREALDDGKAVDIRVLDVGAMTVITDYMVIASGRSSRQVKALTERVLEAAKSCGAEVIGVEGEGAAEWVLVDLGDIIVHIMRPESRDFYQLEKLWEATPSQQVDAR
ncbi:MAG: ribosome silencing factor [Gammaproteobacteria bacterium]